MIINAKIVLRVGLSSVANGGWIHSQLGEKGSQKLWDFQLLILAVISILCSIYKVLLCSSKCMTYMGTYSIHIYKNHDLLTMFFRELQWKSLSKWRCQGNITSSFCVLWLSLLSKLKTTARVCLVSIIPMK